MNDLGLYAHMPELLLTYNYSPLIIRLEKGIQEVPCDLLNFVFYFPILCSFDNNTDQHEMQRLKLTVKLIYDYLSWVSFWTFSFSWIYLLLLVDKLIVDNYMRGHIMIVTIFSKSIGNQNRTWIINESEKISRSCPKISI